MDGLEKQRHVKAMKMDKDKKIVVVGREDVRSSEEMSLSLDRRNCWDPGGNGENNLTFTLHFLDQHISLFRFVCLFVCLSKQPVLIFTLTSFTDLQPSPTREREKQTPLIDRRTKLVSLSLSLSLSERKKLINSFGVMKGEKEISHQSSSNSSSLTLHCNERTTVVNWRRERENDVLLTIRRAILSFIRSSRTTMKSWSWSLTFNWFRSENNRSSENKTTSEPTNRRIFYPGWERQRRRDINSSATDSNRTIEFSLSTSKEKNEILTGVKRIPELQLRQTTRWFSSSTREREREKRPFLTVVTFSLIDKSRKEDRWFHFVLSSIGIPIHWSLFQDNNSNTRDDFSLFFLSSSLSSSVHYKQLFNTVEHFSLLTFIDQNKFHSIANADNHWSSFSNPFRANHSTPRRLRSIKARQRFLRHFHTDSTSFVSSSI